MYNFILLLRVRIKEMSDSSKFIFIPIYAAVFFVLFKLAEFMGEQGLGQVLPITSYIGAMLVTFIIVLLKINERFSGNEDSEFLLSMPFSAATQVFVLFITMYIENLLYCVLIEAPFYIAYLRLGLGEIGFGRWLVGLLFTSLPVCGIATLVGMVIILSIVHSPKKNQILSAISLTFIAIALIVLTAVVDRIYLISNGVVNIDAASSSELIITELVKNLRLARFYQLGIVKGDFGYIMLFAFMSTIWYAVFLFMHTMAYQTAITELRSPVTYGEKDSEVIIGMMKEQSLRRSMFDKELSQFFQSKTYLTHSMLGILLGLIVPINFIIIGTEGFSSIAMKLPVILCIFIGISCTSYCSMSIEGRRYWIMEASPANDRELRRAKVLVNLVLTVPMALLSGSLSIYAFGPGIGLGICYILVPTAYAVLTAYWGAWIGNKYANFNVESEEIVMNTGVPFLLGYLPGVVLPIVGLFI